MSPGGRRPGKLTARDDIIRAARETFAAEGYDGTSLRAVARRAGVDAALVHHYFEGKAGLFIDTIALPFDPGHELADAGANTSGEATAAALVVAFLTMWDRAEGGGSSFVSCVGAMAASPAVAEAMHEFVRACVWPHIAPVEGEGEGATEIRRALVASQLVGLAYTRYILRVAPISTSSPPEIGGWVGSALERSRTDPFE
jgi:AcrR family transcriptional regulator